ncbi:PdaC/SigV domain-containing protein [Paenibacillus sp. GCM10012306]|uniref:PdaC/SigV domain-containing protein n=1 Tax=Paenibacillus sp. GCM10012306 TaxID=3317342 RepID=UPI00361FB04C
MSKIAMKNGRKWGVGLLAAGLLLSGGVLPVHTSFAAPAVKNPSKADTVAVLKWNGVLTQQTGIVRSGEVFVPVTFLRDVVKLPVSYSQTDSAYTIGKGSAQTKLLVSSYGVSITVNNFFIREYEGLNVNNRLYVPLGLLTDYMGYKGDWNAPSGRLNLMVSPQNALKITSANYAKGSEDEGAVINLDYPQISGLANADAQQKINAALKQSTMRFAAGAEADIADRDEESRPYEYDAGYVVTYNQNGVLSLLLNQYGYTGGAHGMSYRQAFTFSLKDGKQLLLRDLFGANPNYKKDLNTKLSQRFKADEGYFGGFTGLNTEQSYYLKDGKVVIFFQLYEYTPYAAGFPEFTFTFKELLPNGSSPFSALK